MLKSQVSKKLTHGNLSAVPKPHIPSIGDMQYFWGWGILISVLAVVLKMCKERPA
jgi:hypothetical protein